MKIEIFINGDKFICPTNNFSESFLNIIRKSVDNKLYSTLHKTKANEIKILAEICQKDQLVYDIDKHLTLEDDFANKLMRLDIVYCSCLQPKTAIGEVIKELMIDNYQLILTNRNWLETDFLKLYFELVDFGETDSFINGSL